MTDINDLAKVLHQAFAIALEGRQGPVLVDIPKDIQLAEVNGCLDELVSLKNKVKLPPANVGSAIALLNQAKQPVLYVGGGVGMANAVDELREFASITGVPSVSTLKGLGAIDPEDEKLFGHVRHAWY